MLLMCSLCLNCFREVLIQCYGHFRLGVCVEVEFFVFLVPVQVQFLVLSYAQQLAVCVSISALSKEKPE